MSTKITADAGHTQRTLTRRDVLATSALAGSAMLLAGRAGAQPPQPDPNQSEPAPPQPDKDFKSKEDNPARENVPPGHEHFPPGEPGKDYTPVVVPNGWTLPYKVVDGVKVFHLVAEEVEHEFAPGLKATCWGYNGGVHGPVIEVVEGDRVRIFVTNKLTAPTTIHWHGVLLPSGMDGVGGLSQKAILPGETFMYEFTLVQHGTLMYHSHHDEMTQMGLGLTGMFVIHPRNPKGPRPDRDFVLLLHEWKIDVGAKRPDPNEMTDFNILTFNAKAFPGTQPLIAKRGDRIRIRIGNLSAMSHHPIHLHGYYFMITETDGGTIPDAGQWPETTVLLPVGSTRTVEFTADNPGDWAMHCHMTHHLMNQMGEGLPNMIGVDTRGLDKQVRNLLPDYMAMGQTGMGDMGTMGMKVPDNSIPMLGAIGPKDEITMGGMFTILKVRETLSNYDEDPGWYADPPGTLASLAAAEALRQNSVANDGSTAPRATAEAMRSWPQADPGRLHTPSESHRNHGSHDGGGR
ncbi:MAG: multicopper oxidase domain-containing protein [Phycisphaerales bacterium]|nr:multicopper oxidase domain-containing protein [Phycisphaerales bacterium]